MLSSIDYTVIGSSLVASVLVAYFSTPLSVKIAGKIGAIDVPADGRRMHDHPIPRLGGLAIIIAFVIVSFIAGRYHALMLRQIVPGALIIGVLGVIDDAKRLPAWPKFLVQCVAAGIAVLSGVRVTGISLFGFLDLGVLSVPITILWIVGITNAVNFIDGLDGLAAGVATIASVSMLLVALVRGQLSVAILTAILAGGCMGLLPYNRNPARVFMGDTGATFLGFALSIISIQGLFKYYAAASFLLPLLILGLPIFDTLTAIVRRLLEGKSPFASDRSHLHHKLIDMGLNQKQAVFALYLISAVLGVMALTFAIFGLYTGLHFLIIGLVLIVIIYLIVLIFSKKCQKESQAEEDSTVKNSADTGEQDPGLPENTIEQAAPSSASISHDSLADTHESHKNQEKEHNGDSEK